MPVASRQPLKDPRETSMAAIAMVYRCMSPRRKGPGQLLGQKGGPRPPLKRSFSTLERVELSYPLRDEAVNDS